MYQSDEIRSLLCCTYIHTIDCNCPSISLVMADVLLQDQSKPSDGVDTYLAEKEEAVNASEGVSRPPSPQPDSAGETGLSTTENGVVSEKVEAPIPTSKTKQQMYTLLEHPIPGCKPTPRPNLTSDQQRKYDSLLETVKSWTSVPTTSAKNSPTEPLSEDDRLWLTRECLLRYLRATSFHSVDAAAKRLLTTLTWRREYGLSKFTLEYISVENETGKQTVFGFDNEGRPCLYMNPSKQNTKMSERQLHHLVFMMERAIDLMPPGQETSALLINFKESGAGKNPSVSQGRQSLHILQGHYPERLGKALISERKSPSQYSCYTSPVCITREANLTSLQTSSLVRSNLLPPHLAIHRPCHKIENEVQRAHHPLRPHRPLETRVWWRRRLCLQPRLVLACAVLAGGEEEDGLSGSVGEGWQGDWGA